MKKTAFTLVELIVVITILAILATIGFVSFSGYLAGTRDTNRIAQLKSMSDALELYRTKKDLPIPDDKVDVQAGTTTIAYQGYIGSNVLETIEYTEKGLDPKDKTYFSYYLTKNKKYFQLLSFLEEPSEDVLVSNTNTDTYTNRNNNIFTSSQAADYSERYPHTKGKKLGILTDENNTPIQEVSAIETAGSLDISDVGTTNYKTIISDEEIITGSGTSLAGMNPIGSCKRIKQIKGSSDDGTYTIDPESNGTGFEVYCDMTTDGGGWTMLWKNFGGPNFSNYGVQRSNNTLWASTTPSELVKPYAVSKKIGSEKNIEAWNALINTIGVELIKLGRGYTNGDLSIEANYSYDVRLDLGKSVSFNDIMDTASCKVLNNQVEVYVDGVSHGKTDRTAGYNSATSIGLANDRSTDNCGQNSDNLLRLPHSRHLVSYNHNTAGRDTVRCQEDCWDGSENIVQETVWGIR